MANFRWQVGGCGCDCEPAFSCSKTFVNAPCLLGSDLTKPRAIALFNAWNAKYKNFFASLGVLVPAQDGASPGFVKLNVPENSIENIYGDNAIPIVGTDLFPPHELSFYRTTFTEAEIDEKVSNLSALDANGFYLTACKECESQDSLYAMSLPVGNLNGSFSVDNSSYTEVRTTGSSSSAVVSATSTVTFSGTDSYNVTIGDVQPARGVTFIRNNIRYAIAPEAAYYRFFTPSASLVNAFKNTTFFDSSVTYANNSLVCINHPYATNYGGTYSFESSAPVLYRTTTVGGVDYYYRYGPATVTASPTGSLLVGGSAKVTGVNVTTPPSAPVLQNNTLHFPNIAFDVLISGPIKAAITYGIASITQEEFSSNATPDNTVTSFSPYDYIETLKTELQSILSNDITSLIEVFYKPITGLVAGLPAERLVFGNWSVAPSSSQPPSIPPRFQDCQENV